MTATTDPTRRLYLAFELGRAKWKVAFSSGVAQAPRIRTIPARDLLALGKEITYAKRSFGLPFDAPVLSCYEAGRDGFWIHRALLSLDIENLVVDSSSIEVDRRMRRAKADRLDARKLLRMLLRYAGGERELWRVVNVPTPEIEDSRQLHRELMTTTRERTRVLNRLHGLLATQGIVLEDLRSLPEQRTRLRIWDGSPLPPELSERLVREWQKVLFFSDQLNLLSRKRARLMKASSDPAIEQIKTLMTLKGIGINTAWLYVMEFFAWREFKNRRQVGALAGLTPTPYQSGEDSREQGISKAGNRHIRALAIEIAWRWLHHQPQSELSRWYQKRFGHGSARVRKIGIVALARKLLIALWVYLGEGTLPQGAALKA